MSKQQYEEKTVLPLYISPQVLPHVDVSRGVVRKKSKMFGLVKNRGTLWTTQLPIVVFEFKIVFFYG